MGGLGNQLFQWATSTSIGLDNNTESYLDTSFYDNQNGNTIRTFDISKFTNIKYNLLSDYISTNPHSHINLKQVNDNFIYQDITDNSYLNGYWQSEKYFKNNEDIIREQLIPSNDVQFKLTEKYPGLLEKSVSLHIRRTDYVNQQQNHPLQPMEYYYEALKQIGDYDVLYVFSDDIDWCKYNTNFQKAIYVSNDSDQEDIWHMSMCSNNIIANSTFSWWGAWLNSNPEKIVITPNKWFGSSLGHLPTDDLIPESWIKI